MNNVRFIKLVWEIHKKPNILFDKNSGKEICIKCYKKLGGNVQDALFQNDNFENIHNEELKEIRAQMCTLYKEQAESSKNVEKFL